MQYDLKKDLTEKSTFAMQWHGDDTKVLIHGDAEKTEVKKGDVIKVCLKQARELLSYSYLWTLEGDKPAKHQYDAMMAKLAAKKAKADETDEGSDKEIDAENIDKMKKPELVTALKKLGASFNDQATKPELAGLLKEVLAEKAKADETDEVKEGDVIEGKGIAHYLTEEDIENNPDLEESAKVGDLIFIPEEQN